MKAIQIMLGVFIGALTGAVIEGMEGKPKMIAIAVFGAGVLVCIIIVGLDYTYKKMWPAKSNWEYTTNDLVYPQKVFKDGEYVRWQSPKPQEDGMFYRLDLKKGRVISGLHFDHGFTSNVPERWTIAFSDEMDFMLLPNRDGTKRLISGTDSIIVQEIESPIKARYIHITITKPRMENNEAYHWHIEDIYIRENKLGRFYRRLIR